MLADPVQPRDTGCRYATILTVELQLGIMPQTLDTNREFEALARRFLVAHPEIRCEWRQIRSALSGGRTDLLCKPGDSREVFASLRSHQVTVGAHSEDTDFEDFGRGLSEEQVAREAFSHFIHLLTEKGILSTNA